jgi:hypothetical protein
MTVQPAVYRRAEALLRVWHVRAPIDGVWHAILVTIRQQPLQSHRSGHLFAGRQRDTGHPFGDHSASNQPLHVDPELAARCRRIKHHPTRELRSSFIRHRGSVDQSAFIAIDVKS